MFKIEDPNNIPVTDEVRDAFRYQPFLLGDGTYTGAGANQLRNSPRRVLTPAEADAEDAAEFIAANTRLAEMNDDFVAGLLAEVGDPSALSYCDLASNAGYFTYKMALAGFGSVTGVDPGNHHAAYAYVKQALGVEVEFVNSPYDSRLHLCPALEDRTFDVVSSMAFILHNPDPQFVLNYVCELATKTVMISTEVHEADGYEIKFADALRQYRPGKFPYCFSSRAMLSEKMVRLCFEENGFDKVTELKRQPHWIHGATFRCFIATKGSR